MELVDNSQPFKMDVVRYGIYFIEGVTLLGFNSTIFFSILWHKALFRAKEYIMIASLAFVDSCNGLAAISAALYRIPLILDGTHNVLVSRRRCFATVHNVLWTFVFSMQGLTLSIITFDRLLSVLIPLKYLGFGRRYALGLVGGVYSIGLLSVLVGGVTVTGEINQTVKAICLTGWALKPFFYDLIYVQQTAGTFFSIILYIPVILLYKKRNKIFPHTSRMIARNFKRQKRLTKSLAFSCLFTFIFFGLPNIAILTSHFMNFEFEFITPWAYIISNLNPAMNLLIYWKRQKEFAMGVKAFLKCKSMPPTMELWQSQSQRQ